MLRPYPFIKVITDSKTNNTTSLDMERPSDDSFSGYVTETAESLHRDFTEVTLYRQTATHQLFRAKRFGRWYLLKALLPELRGSTFHRQMLVKEMEVLMQLNHPNIVGCLGLEHLDDYTDSVGRQVSVGECLVLEFIEGDALSDLMAEDQLTSAKTCERIIDELLDALSYMHASSVTHRDLKPSNIMITRNGQHVKIIDFSLADTDSHAYLKQPSGTRQYMAPEQTTGTVPDGRNDIYSVGVIIGQLPLNGYWADVARRCTLPIDQRYPNVAAMQDEIANHRQRASRLRLASFIAVPVLLLTIIGTVLWHQFSARQGLIFNELNRLPAITSQALNQLDHRIAETGLNRQMDTISQWKYLDPQINEKILSVNAFAYDYALDSLPDLTDDERLHVLQQMLDRWQQWHDNIVRRAKFLIKNREHYVTHYAEETLNTYSSTSER